MSVVAMGSIDINHLGVAVVALVAVVPQLGGHDRSGPRGSGGATSGRCWVRPAAALLVVIGAVAGLLGSPLLAVSGPMAGLVTWRELVRHRAGARRRVRSLGTMRFVDELTASVRAGGSLAMAVSAACRRLPYEDKDRTGSGAHDNRAANDVLWIQLRARIDGGRPMRDAFDDFLRTEQTMSSDERLIAITIVALDTTGASALEALERVGDALRERGSSREEARTQGQQAFASAAVLSALPAVFGVAAALAEPEVAEFYTQRWIGALCVLGAFCFSLGGWEWLRRLLEGSR